MVVQKIQCLVGCKAERKIKTRYNLKIFHHSLVFGKVFVLRLLLVLVKLLENQAVGTDRDGRKRDVSYRHFIRVHDKRFIGQELFRRKENQ